MELNYKTRPHSLDWLAIMQGTRWFTLDVWIDATPDEIAKLRSFNMLKLHFIDAPKPRGFAPAIGFVLSALATWFATYNFEAPVILCLFAVTAICAWLAKISIGKTTKGSIKVSDLLHSRPVPFTRDNMADIHAVVLSVDESYQRLFGGMFEIEHYQVKREAVWREEVEA